MVTIILVPYKMAEADVVAESFESANLEPRIQYLTKALDTHLDIAKAIDTVVVYRSLAVFSAEQADYLLENLKAARLHLKLAIKHSVEEI